MCMCAHRCTQVYHSFHTVENARTLPWFLKQSETNFSHHYFISVFLVNISVLYQELLQENFYLTDFYTSAMYFCILHDTSTKPKPTQKIFDIWPHILLHFLWADQILKRSSSQHCHFCKEKYRTFQWEPLHHVQGLNPAKGISSPLCHCPFPPDYHIQLETEKSVSN